MTATAAPNLLQQPVDTTHAHAPAAPMHTRHVTHVIAQPQPMYLPAPAAAPAPRTGGGAVSAIALALVVVLLGAVALIGAYYATTQASPTDREAAVVSNIAARSGFRDGRQSGIEQGRSDALSFSSTTTAMRAAIARQQAYNAAYRRGMKAGQRYRAPRWSGYSSGYRAPRIGGFGGYETAAAIGQAQNLANLTGAPVDVEIY